MQFFQVDSATPTFGQHQQRSTANHRSEGGAGRKSGLLFVRMV
jgi:hypothetical protein